MEQPKNEFEIKIISKFDFELSNAEVNKIYQIYNECFYDSKVLSRKLVKKAHDLINKHHVWKWYLAYLQPNIQQNNQSNTQPSTQSNNSQTTKQELIGIAAYVYDTSNLGKLDLTINPEVGENICNVGTKRKYRQHGVATHLMEEIINDPEIKNKDLVVEVLVGSPQYQSVMKLYTNLGFVQLSQKVHLRYLILPRLQTTIDKLKTKNEIEDRVAQFLHNKKQESTKPTEQPPTEQPPTEQLPTEQPPIDQKH